MEEEWVPSVPAFSRSSGTISPGLGGLKSPKKRRVSKLRCTHDDRLRQTILCKIAHIRLDVADETPKHPSLSLQA